MQIGAIFYFSTYGGAEWNVAEVYWNEWEISQSLLTLCFHFGEVTIVASLNIHHLPVRKATSPILSCKELHCFL